MSELGTVQPNHDFLGIIGVRTQEKTIIYGVIPRFWKQGIPSEYQADSHVRILKQNQNTQLPKQDATHLNIIEKQIQEELLEADTPEKMIETIELSSETETTILSTLYRLCRYYHKEKREDKDTTDTLALNSNGLPIFLFEEFIDLLTPKIRELRRSYRPVIEEIGAIRGRITRRGMLDIKARPSPKIECEFETFDVNAPIYRILVTTLETIASTDVFGADPSFDFLRQALVDEDISIKERAVSLRRKMSAIPNLSVPQAIKQSKMLSRRLPRSFKGFQRLIELAHSILSQQSQSVQNDDQHKWWHITAPSSKIWELLLEKSFLQIERATVNPQVNLKGPWESKGQKSIDLCVTINNNKTWLFDAKYANIKDTPSSGYQYQQFFYAVAYQKQLLRNNKNETLQSVALIHATISGLEEHSFDLVSDLQEIWGGRNIPFQTVNIPFPQIEDIQQQSASFLADYFQVTKMHLSQYFNLENQYSPVKK